jgi:hypothetical protein
VSWASSGYSGCQHFQPSGSRIHAWHSPASCRSRLFELPVYQKLIMVDSIYPSSCGSDLKRDWQGHLGTGFDGDDDVNGTDELNERRKHIKLFSYSASDYSLGGGGGGVH